MHLLKLLLVLFVCAAGPAVAGPFEDATEAFNKGNYATALRLWRSLAEQGDAEAHYNLGTMYYVGHGVTQDYAAAVPWFRKAAELGIAEAQYNLGNMYTHGHGVPQDYAAALSWVRNAADQGLAEAKLALPLISALRRLCREGADKRC